MRVGHIDGLGAVYDTSGNPILTDGERLLRHVPEDNISVSESSGMWTARSHFGFSAEKGDLFLTERRLLFLRRPDPLLAARDDAYPIGMADAVARGYRAHKLRAAGALEYCEIELSEVEGFWVKKRTCGVLFLKSPERVARKAVLYQRGLNDDKISVLKSLLIAKLPVTEPEDRKGSLLLGARYPFRGKRK